MDKKDRIEQIRELINQRARLRHHLPVYKSFAPRITNKEQISDGFEIVDNANIDDINTKLFLLGQ